MLVDAGGFASKTGRQKGLLTEYFMRGLALIGYQAVNIGQAELSLGVSAIQEANRSARLPLLSANVTDKKGKPLFQESIECKVNGQPIFIVGLTTPGALLPSDSSKYQVEEPLSAFKRVMDKSKKKSSSLVVVVTDMSDDPLRRFLDVQEGADVVVTATDFQYSETPLKVKGAFVVSEQPETKNGSMLVCEAESGQVTLARGSRTPLETKYDKHAAMDALFKQYDQALVGVKFKYPRPANAQKLYAGSAACLECHRNVGELEKKGPHVKAFAVLEKTGNSYNPACLSCHVTGYEKENGFWDIETSRDMAGVQCEQCHGAQMAHVTEERRFAFGKPDFSGMSGGSENGGPTARQSRPYKVGMYSCARCHSGEFVLKETPEEAWKKVGHKK